MGKIKFFFFSLFIAFLTIQCDDDNPKPPTDPYVGCCGSEPVELTIGNAKLFIPNAFTPNGDGINDLFFPTFNNKTAKIEAFSISTDKLGIMYFTLNVDTQNPAASGWNGKDADGKKYAGPFSYVMTVTDDAGFLQTFAGTSCSILCDTFATMFKTKTGCFFPTQSNGNGGLDAGLPTLEDDCFEN